MSEEENKESTPTDAGEGDKPETIKILKQQGKRIKKLEKERDERIMEDAKKQIAGTAEGGKPAEEKKKETPQEAAKRYVVENFANLK